MAEIVLGADDNPAEVAQALLELAGEQPDRVMWAPRPDVPRGGVYVVPDEIADKYSSASSASGTKKGRHTKAADTTDTTGTDATTETAA